MLRVVRVLKKIKQHYVGYYFFIIYFFLFITTFIRITVSDEIVQQLLTLHALCSLETSEIFYKLNVPTTDTTHNILICFYPKGGAPVGSAEGRLKGIDQVKI